MAINSAQREHLWNVYVEIGKMEFHYGDAQIRYRSIASTWTLAAMAAIGFLISEKVEFFAWETLIMLVGVTAAIVLCIVWIIDLVMYQRLLDAAYLEGMCLERAQRWLPQIRNNRRALLKGTGLGRLSYYYAGGVTIMFSIGGIGLVLALVPILAWFYLVPTSLGYTIVCAFLVIKLLRVTASTKQYEERITTDRTRDYLQYEEDQIEAFTDVPDSRKL